MTFVPMPLIVRRDAFDSPDYVFELKHDGFRTLAFIENETCHLVSKKGNQYKSFTDLCAWVGANLDVRDAVLDGEIVCLDQFGRSVFNNLFFRRDLPYLVAFDILWLNGKDLRDRPLTERKKQLRRIIPPKPSLLLYLDHVAASGTRLFEAVCSIDCEGVIAKPKVELYRPEHRPSQWIKIRNPHYSQRQDREELFEPRQKP